MGENGRFGVHGGQYIPEILMNAVVELEENYNRYKNDPEFNAELTALWNAKSLWERKILIDRHSMCIE